ncbi:hypothetical protein CRUP_000982 [Coryphaenoides rupestris]|nr:hypothetical protein CRUP_000982 [Coryphaenoides rupestris]
MIDGTPVLDIKPYISDYDSPLTRPGVGVEPCEMDVDQSETTVLSPNEVTDDTVSLRTDSGSPSSLARAGVTKVAKVTRGNSHPGSICKHEAIAARTEASSLAVADANANSAAPLSEELSSVLAEVKAYVNEADPSGGQEVSKPKRPETPPWSPGPSYGEEACNSTVAAWIRAPPAGTLEVRFTPHALRELAAFLQPQESEQETDPPGSVSPPHFKFLRGPEEAEVAIRAVLSADPRSVYMRTRCGDRLFFFTLDTAHMTCWFGPGFAEVLRVQHVGS